MTPRPTALLALGVVLAAQPPADDLVHMRFVRPVLIDARFWIQIPDHVRRISR